MHFNWYQNVRALLMLYILVVIKNIVNSENSRIAARPWKMTGWTYYANLRQEQAWGGHCRRIWRYPIPEKINIRFLGERPPLNFSIGHRVNIPVRHMIVVVVNKLSSRNCPHRLSPGIVSTLCSYWRHKYSHGKNSRLQGRPFGWRVRNASSWHPGERR